MGQHLATADHFGDGLRSVTYVVTTLEEPKWPFLLQLRYGGNVASTNMLLTIFSLTCPPGYLPLPDMFPLPAEEARERKTGWAIQISRFIPGIIASSVYNGLYHYQKRRLVQNIARAYTALWEIPLPQDYDIGALVASKRLKEEAPNGTKKWHLKLKVCPNYLGGPFQNVSDYLLAPIKAQLRNLEVQQGIDEFKKHYLKRIQRLAEAPRIPEIVNDIPNVVTHLELGPHNIIVDKEESFEIKAIIGWEAVASVPFGASNWQIEKWFFKNQAVAWDLRKAFWDTVPKKRSRLQESQAMKLYLEWCSFIEDMVPEPCFDKSMSTDEREMKWVANIRSTETFLAKHEAYKSGWTRWPTAEDWY